MTMPFYVSPEQLMKDRADFARKGIARGRSVIVIAYRDGILFATENPSRALHKTSEIYDRLAFAAVGKYNEFEALRVAGIRYADLRGYSYDRVDVTARGLANTYAQTLGTMFTNEAKPFEVELVVAELGVSEESDELYRISYDGSVVQERGFVVIGGDAARLSLVVEEGWRAGMDLSEVLRLGGQALSAGGAETGDLNSFEVAILDRNRVRRTFRRIGAGELAETLNSGEPGGAGSGEATETTGG